MTITQKQAIEAYKVVERVRNEPLPIRTAYALFTLRQKLAPAWEFQIEQEQKFIELTSAVVNPDGTANFPSEDECKSFLRMKAELEAEPVEIDFEPIELPDTLTLSMNEIESVFPFVKVGE